MSAPLYCADQDFTLYQGDALEVLRELPAGSVHMCCTSPPFYGLRDYGTGSWEGGDPGCDHVASRSTQNLDKLGERYRGDGKKQSTEGAIISTYRDTCGKCGARRVDRQIGLEETPEQWVERLAVGIELNPDYCELAAGRLSQLSLLAEGAA